MEANGTIHLSAHKWYIPKHCVADIYRHSVQFKWERVCFKMCIYTCVYIFWFATEGCVACNCLVGVRVYFCETNMFLLKHVFVRRVCCLHGECPMHRRPRVSQCVTVLQKWHDNLPPEAKNSNKCRFPQKMGLKTLATLFCKTAIF